MRRFPPAWLGVVLCLLWSSAGGATEPSAEIEATVRTVALRPLGERVRVELELTVRATRSASRWSAAVRRWGEDRDRSPDLAVARGTVTGDGAWTTRIVLDLVTQELHDLRFVIADDSGGGAAIELHHRVDLDTSRAPRRRLGALEFRGLTSGRQR